MTKLAILTYNEILTQLTVLYSTLYINTKKQNKKNPAICTTISYSVHKLPGVVNR